MRELQAYLGASYKVIRIEAPGPGGVALQCEQSYLGKRILARATNLFRRDIQGCFTHGGMSPQRPARATSLSVSGLAHKLIGSSLLRPWPRMAPPPTRDSALPPHGLLLRQPLSLMPLQRVSACWAPRSIPLAVRAALRLSLLLFCYVFGRKFLSTATARCCRR